MKKNNSTRGRPKKVSTLHDQQVKYKTKITDYDFDETTDFINPDKPLSLRDIGFTLPPTSPTQVVSIRLPSVLLNQIRALSSERDVSYQALIKIFLSDSVKKLKKGS